MGTVPSVRVKAAGKSKEVNLAVKDSTDSRTKGIVNTFLKFMYVSIDKYLCKSEPDLIAWRFVFVTMFPSVSMLCSFAASGDPPREACPLSTESLL